jgi:hypothetical protein
VLKVSTLHTTLPPDSEPVTPDAGLPGQWVDNLYLNWPAGGDDKKKQSFFWFQRPFPQPHRRQRVQGHGVVWVTSSSGASRTATPV